MLQTTRLYIILTFTLLFSENLTSSGQSAKKEILFKHGFGMVNYVEYEPFKEKPIDIFYYIPEEGDIKTMPVLLAMHGAARDAKELVQAMSTEAKAKKVMVFAPRFDLKLYPISDYQEVGIMTADKQLKKESERTTALVDKIFEFILAHSESNAQKFDIYGHSAGGQFVHRFMLFCNSRYVNRAMAGSPGFYTLPDTTISYPYGLKSTPFANEKAIRAFLAKNITLHLGTKDTLRETFLKTTPEAEKQGRNRYERGEYFYRYLQQIAAGNKWKFNWTKVVTPDVPHDSRLMGKIGLNYLYK